MDLGYIKKYNELPEELRGRLNALEVVSDVDNIEKKFGLSIAAVIMRIMTKDIPVDSIKEFFMEEEGFDEKKAADIADEIKEKVLYAVWDYFGHGADVSTLDPEKVIEEAAKVRGSSFFFSPEDEEEIRKIAKATDTGGKVYAIIVPGSEVEDRIKQIIEAAQINFGSEFLRDRFKQILRTYIKGIRNALDTKLTFKKPFDAGGLSFDDESIEKIMSIAYDFLIKGKHTNVAVPKKIAVPEDQAASKRPETGDKGRIKDLQNLGVRDFDYDLSLLTKKKEEKEKKGAVAEEAKPKITIKKKEVPESADKTLKADSRPAVEPIGKVKMEDIRYMPPSAGNIDPHLMTPIDELLGMDLVTFRRLGQQDPFRSVAKIKEKIKGLEDESYTKKMEGVEAWKNSPTNKLYLEIGERSIRENKPIDVIMAERKFSNSDNLTNLEFEAIMDLNKELRF